MFIKNIFIMGKNSLCKFASTCPLYQGKEDKKGTDLVIYKNVFCHRGLDGWNNCKQYIDFTNANSSSE
jgi:hypothetical protein